MYEAQIHRREQSLVLDLARIVNIPGSPPDCGRLLYDMDLENNEDGTSGDEVCAQLLCRSSTVQFLPQPHSQSPHPGKRERERRT